MLETEDEIQEIYALLDTPQDYKILYMRSNDYRHNSTTLGFDVGHATYSIISDAIICPLWHPAPADDYDALLPYYQTLNEHILFNSVSDAKAYHRYYSSRPWSEQGDFECWQIDSWPM